MGLRQSFSKLRKKAKDKVAKVRDKIGRGRANLGGEEFNRSALSLQSEPGIVTGDELTGGIGVGIGEGNLRPDDSRFVSHSAVELGRGQGGSGGEAERGGTSQKDLHPHSHVQTESGSSQERGDVGETRAGKVHPPPRPDIGNAATLTPSNPHGGESESM